MDEFDWLMVLYAIEIIVLVIYELFIKKDNVMTTLKKAGLYEEITANPFWDGRTNLKRCSKEQLIEILNELKQPKVYITLVSWNTSDDRGTEILGVYRKLKDAETQAQQEVEQWKDDFSYNDDVVFGTDNETSWVFDDRMSVYVKISILTHKVKI